MVLTPKKHSYDGKGTKPALIFILVILVLVFGVYTYYKHQNNKIDNLNKQVSTLKKNLSDQKKKYNDLKATYSYTSKLGLEVKIFHPLTNEKVASPVEIIGEVPGNWSYQGNFPVQFMDSKNNLIAQTTATLLGNWQTDQLVPFSAKIEYQLSGGGTGSIILKKGNAPNVTPVNDSVILPISY